MNIINHFFLSILLPSLLLGCVAGADYKKPKFASDIPKNFIGNTSTPSLINFSKDIDTGRWWQSFANPTINKWVELALKNSPTAKMAQATLEQAAASLNLSKANLYPKLNLNLASSRSNAERRALTTTGGSAYTLYNASVEVSYIFDLFGGVKRGVESRVAKYEAAQWQWQGAMNALAGNVVTAAINIASARAQVHDTRAILSLQERRLATIERQREVGTVSDVEVANAKLALANSKNALAGSRKQEQLLANQLTVLLGEFPSNDIAKQIDLTTFALPAEIPLLVPSSLIRDRPDIRLAEAQLKVANADLGLAIAQYYPQISISGSFNLQALNLANLFDSTFWNAGINAIQRLFDGGESSAQEAEAKAAFAYAKANYEQTILNAFSNVAGALTALEQDTYAVSAQTEALEASKLSYHLAKKRHEIGSISNYELLAIERTYQQTRIGHIQSLAIRLADISALYLAAGGNTDFSTLGLVTSTNQK